jgi:hypothetical protein
MGRCIYCNSTSYGKPCLFSSTSTHVHFDSPDKCIYCGSKSLGGGCMFNPFGKNHIRGPEFLANVKEQVQKSAILSYLYENLSNPNKESFFTPLGRFYKRLMEIVSITGNSLFEAFNLQSKPNYAELSKKDLMKSIELKEKLMYCYDQLNKTIQEANLCLPQEMVENIIIDAIISKNEKET